MVFNSYKLIIFWCDIWSLDFVYKLMASLSKEENDFVAEIFWGIRFRLFFSFILVGITMFTFFFRQVRT